MRFFLEVCNVLCFVKICWITNLFWKLEFSWILLHFRTFMNFCSILTVFVSVGFFWKSVVFFNFFWKIMEISWNFQKIGFFYFIETLQFLECNDSINSARKTHQIFFMNGHIKKKSCHMLLTFQIQTLELVDFKTWLEILIFVQIKPPHEILKKNISLRKSTTFT